VCRQDPTDNSCTGGARVCWPALEVDRLNVRPEGLEAVVEDDLDLDVNPRDPQVSFFDSTVRSFFCRTTRDGFLADDAEPFPSPGSSMLFEMSPTIGDGGGECVQPPIPPIPVERP
jgi:hypothetical protein